MLALFPETARLENGELTIGGISASELAERFGTPLVVYCERSLRARARLFRAAAPEALVVYGTKAFANVSLLRLLAEEGVGADVSTLGELAFARAAGIEGERILFHGNNKSDEELRAAAELGALVVLDAPDEPERAATAGVRRALVRVTPGVEAETHEAIRTGHRGSKFGLDADDALEAIRRALAAGIDIEGLHVHVGSQLLDARAHLQAVELLAGFAARAREELGWTAAVVDVGGGFGIRYVLDEPEPPLEELVRTIVEEVRQAWARRELPEPRLILEPGRSLVGAAACTLYTVGASKRAGDRSYVAIDGGMSDNPRPQLYGARYAALLANRADEDPAEEPFTIAGKHCESGDVLIESVLLPEPRRGDLLAVPATGAYTLGMASTYNSVPRPAAVLVLAGEAQLILRRETVEDLLLRDTCEFVTRDRAPGNARARRLIIRRAEHGDAEGIAWVCAAGWRDTYRGIKEPEQIEAVIAEYYTPQRITREIDAPEGWDGWIVAIEGDTVIGAGGGGMIEAGVGEIFVLYLDPVRRREGVGTLLLEAISEPQRSQGAREQWVSVAPENNEGLPFYYSRGFEQRGQRPEWGSSPEEGRVSLRLWRQLDPDEA